MEPHKNKDVSKRQVDVGAVADAVAQLLRAIGEDPKREGLVETPERVARFYLEFMAEHPINYSRFHRDGTDTMVVVNNIPFFSLCEHHLLPFFGTAAVAYIPKIDIVGLSKIARTIKHYSSGLQNQERITQQVADRLVTELDPQGVGVILRARHLCMEMRGVRTFESYTTTSALRGEMMDESTKTEFFRFINQNH